MKNTHQYFVLFLSVFLILSCGKTEPLPRNNVYDLNRDEGKHQFALDHISIVEESVSDNEILTSGEKMYLQVFIKNIGTEPGKVNSTFFTETSTGTLDFEPQQTVSGISDFTGDFIVKDFIEPGQSAMVYAGETPDGNIPYSIRVEKRPLATPPIEIGEIRLKDGYDKTWKMSLTINVN